MCVCVLHACVCVCLSECVMGWEVESMSVHAHISLVLELKAGCNL